MLLSFRPVTVLGIEHLVSILGLVNGNTHCIRYMTTTDDLTFISLQFALCPFLLRFAPVSTLQGLQT